MEIIWQVLALILVMIGTFFSIIGALGLVRLPDVYTRLHAAGKVGVFGAAFLAGATVLLAPAVSGKAMILIVLLVIAGPVVSHALASAAYRMGIPVKRAVRDDLAGERARRSAGRDSLNRPV